MEAVAVSKMRKTQEHMVYSRSYAENMRSVIGHLALGSLELNKLKDVGSAWMYIMLKQQN